MAPLIIAGIAAVALAMKSKTAGSPTALPSTSINTPLLGTGQVSQAPPQVPQPGTTNAGAGTGTNTTPIEILQLPPEVSAGRYATPVTPYFPAGFSGQMSPMSSLPMTPAANVKPSGVQMTGTVGNPVMGIFMEGPVYTQRGTPSTPVGAYTMGEVARPPSLPTGASAPTSSVGLINPVISGPGPTGIQQQTIVASQ